MHRPQNKSWNKAGFTVAAVDILRERVLFKNLRTREKLFTQTTQQAFAKLGLNLAAEHPLKIAGKQVRADLYSERQRVVVECKQTGEENERAFLRLMTGATRQLSVHPNSFQKIIAIPCYTSWNNEDSFAKKVLSNVPNEQFSNCEIWEVDLFTLTATKIWPSASSKTKVGGGAPSIPASDRIVRLNHNSPEFKKAYNFIDQVIGFISEIRENSFLQKDVILEALEHGKAMLQMTRVFAKATFTFLKDILRKAYKLSAPFRKQAVIQIPLQVGIELIKNLLGL